MIAGRQKWTWADMLKDEERNLCMFMCLGSFCRKMHHAKCQTMILAYNLSSCIECCFYFTLSFKIAIYNIGIGQHHWRNF